MVAGEGEQMNNSANVRERPPVSPELMRNVMAQWPTGVSVVSSVDGEGKPVGVVIGSFCSISLSPPLVAFALTQSSTSLRVIRDQGLFCVNVLSSSQSDLVHSFCRGDPRSRFAGTDYTLTPAGMPALPRAIAWIEAEVECEHEGGDHAIVLGRVRHMETGPEGKPLVFAQGQLGEYREIPFRD